MSELSLRHMRVPFNRPAIAPNQLAYVNEAFESGQLAGDGPFTKKASSILSDMHGGSKVLLTTSCTSALELTAILLDLSPGDEVIVPSFTFVSSANAYALMGAAIVFAEIDPGTFNITAETIAPLITSRTRAIVAVNYGGAPSVTDELLALADSHGIVVIEDNAHGLFGSHDVAPLGTRAAMSTLSFHATKNISCGEGGALVINDDRYSERAEIIREKGTNRSLFFRGMVDKYTWVDKGSSYLMSDINAAVLLAQLEFSSEIQTRRRAAFMNYMEQLSGWADRVGATLPHHLATDNSPFHLFPVLMPSLEARTRLIKDMNDRGVQLAFHYVPLHSSPGGRQFGRGNTDLIVTQRVSETLVRLPLFSDICEMDQSGVSNMLQNSIGIS